jgi:phosphoglycerate dehydrogenase-like enzyme
VNRILILMPKHFADIMRDVVANELPEFETVYLSDDASLDVVTEALQNSHFLICTGVQISSKLLDEAPMLKLIQKWGAGIDGIDLWAAKERNIYVANVSGGNSVAVAEHFFALLLSLYKKICVADTSMRDGRWLQAELVADRLEELAGKTLGIVGFGQIGRAIASRAVAFEMNVIYYKRNKLHPSEEDLLKVSFTNLPELARQADILALALPLTTATKHLINAEILQLMKSSAVLINVSRGAIINETHLYDSLLDGGIAGAGLDVFEVEPLEASPLLTLPNVVLTPHIAGRTKSAMLFISKQCVANIYRVSKGAEPYHLL